MRSVLVGARVQKSTTPHTTAHVASRLRLSASTSCRRSDKGVDAQWLFPAF